MSKQHIGQILDSVAQHHGLSKVEIIKKAGYGSQSTYYKHIVQADLSFRVLYKYAKAMGYNFSKEIPGFTKWLNSNNLTITEVINDEIASLVSERNSWKEKYYELLEKYNTLLERGK